MRIILIDQVVVQAIYQAHHGWLQGWLHRRIGCAHHAADLTQDTFERLLRAERAGRQYPLREPRAFLTVVAQRVLYEFWRRRDLERAYLDALASSPAELAPSAEERVAVLQALQLLDTALAGLPERTRKVFLLNQLEERSYREIGEQLGMPVITVRRAMARAIAACCAVAD